MSDTTGDVTKVRFLRPQLPTLEEVGVYYDLAEQARFYSNGGPCEQMLRRRLSAYLGGPKCVPVDNATAGIISALRAVTDLRGTSARPLVVTPSYTFAATAGAAVVLGFRPLFVDVDPVGWQMDPDALEQALTERSTNIAAVLATHTFGVPPRAEVRDRWVELCERYRVPLVVDAAAGFGSEDVAGTLTGSGAGTHVFSFHATKPFGIGEGGVIVSSDEDVLRYCDAFRQFGFADGKVAVVAGINAKMDELHAAMALAVLDRYKHVLSVRRRIAERYQAELEPIGFGFQQGSAGGTWQAGYAQAPTPDVRSALLAAGRRYGVEIKAYYDVPLHRQPAYANCARHSDLAVTDGLAVRAIALPMANDLTDAEIDRVVEVARRVVAKAQIGTVGRVGLCSQSG